MEKESLDLVRLFFYFFLHILQPVLNANTRHAAPFVGADVDDTAKGIVSLVALGSPVSPDPMIKEFEAKSHFRTYAHERDSSLSANANALAAFLCQPHAAQYSPQILKAVKFLCDSWWGSDGRIRDKWVRSPFCPWPL